MSKSQPTLQLSASLLLALGMALGTAKAPAASMTAHFIDVGQGAATLLEFSDDPIGDWVAGRHDRLARAELASVGLRP